ncbi:MAG: alpha/beta hydrolase [Thaumarchaeota archaeon]|nr:alpha/beta hydrolase [Nitrososphaerota archaeon]
MPFASANGVNLYYELNGERGDPMMLIHGSWGDHANWQAVVPGLSKSFRVLTYDRRGHSHSEKARTQGSFDEDAQDASALLSSLGITSAHIVGNSGGSIIALKLAGKQPSVFQSLAIHEPPLLDLPLDDPSVAAKLREGKSRAEAVVKVLETGDRPRGARQFVDTIAFGPGAWDKLPPQLRQTFVNNADTWLDEMRDSQGLVVDFESLSKFHKPTLLSYGGKSAPFFRPIVEKLAGVIPGSRLETYPDDGHTPHISNPDEFVRRVTAFAKSSS